MVESCQLMQHKLNKRAAFKHGTLEKYILSIPNGIVDSHYVLTNQCMNKWQFILQCMNKWVTVRWEGYFWTTGPAKASDQMHDNSVIRIWSHCETFKNRSMKFDQPKRKPLYRSSILLSSYCSYDGGKSGRMCASCIRRFASECHKLLWKREGEKARGKASTTSTNGKLRRK